MCEHKAEPMIKCHSPMCAQIVTHIMNLILSALYSEPTHQDKPKTRLAGLLSTTSSMDKHTDHEDDASTFVTVGFTYCREKVTKVPT